MMDNPAGNQKHYDLTLVYEIGKGNMEFVKSLCLIFIRSVPPALLEMQAAAGAQEWSMVNKLAHKMKSTVDTLNVPEGKKLVREIEKKALDSTDSTARLQVPALISALDQVIQMVVAELKEDFQLGDAATGQ